MNDHGQVAGRWQKEGGDKGHEQSKEGKEVEKIGGAG